MADLTPAEIQKLCKLVDWLFSESIVAGYGPDGDDIQEQLVEIGYVEPVAYDPDVHNVEVETEPGETIYVESAFGRRAGRIADAPEPPRSYVYVTERLPEPGEKVRFWAPEGKAIASFLGFHEARQEFPSGGGRREGWRSTTGLFLDPARVYAWEPIPPIPAAPPLPEVERG